MIERRALLLPDPRMWGFKSIAQHGLTAQGATPGLGRP